MADDVKLYTGSNSPQAVALELMKEVAFAEGKELIKGPGNEKPDRDWLLSTFSECLRLCNGNPYRPRDR